MRDLDYINHWTLAQGLLAALLLGGFGSLPHPVGWGLIAFALGGLYGWTLAVLDS